MKQRKTISQRLMFQLADLTDRDDLTIEMRLREDLGLDSLDIVELQVWVEDELDTDVDDDLFWQAKTVRDLIVLYGGAPNFKGLVCPLCGAENELVVEGKSLWKIGPHGFDNKGYETEVKDDNYAMCSSCDWEGCYLDLQNKQDDDQ